MSRGVRYPCLGIFSPANRLWCVLELLKSVLKDTNCSRTTYCSRTANALTEMNTETHHKCTTFS